jgi:tetratricopeptide (TPR) repeat protein
MSNDVLSEHSRRCRSWGLAELLCAESIREASVHPARAFGFAYLAVILASVLREWEPTEVAWLAELRAFAWAHLGNAWRVVGELPNAEQAFLVADRLWNEDAEGMGDVLGYESKILALEASLRRTQGRFGLAISLLDRALAADVNEGLKPEILTSKAFTLGEAGDLDAAALGFREAIAAVNPEDSPRLFFVLHHNLLDALSKAGRLTEASSLLPEVEQLARSAGDPIDLLRVTWIRARMAAASGDGALAEELFEETRRGFLREGIVLDSALATLELACHCLSEGRADRVVEMIRDLLPIFEAQGVRREILATLAVFSRAAEARTATVELARWTIETLKEAGKRQSVLQEEVNQTLTLHSCEDSDAAEIRTQSF